MALTRAWIVLAAAASVVAGCADDDDAAAPTQPPATSTSTSTAPTTSLPGPTSSSEPGTSPTTTVAPSTTSAEEAEEALKAEIAANYEAAFFRTYELLARPDQVDLENQLAEVVVPASPEEDVLANRIEELRDLGDRVVPNEPDLLDVNVERVRLLGERPYTEALVTVCEVNNRRQVTPPENSPNGQETTVLGTGELYALRITVTVRLTESGWLRYETPAEADGIYMGADRCAPS